MLAAIKKYLEVNRKYPSAYTAILIMAKTPSFRHGLPESSAIPVLSEVKGDGNLSVHKRLIKHGWQILVSRSCDWMHSEHFCPEPYGRLA